MPGDKKRYTRSRNVACKIAYPNRKQYILYLKPTKEINPSLLNTKKGKENFQKFNKSYRRKSLKFFISKSAEKKIYEGKVY